ncbi:hypothetical protein [uncultured Methanobrevibacter sp.]|nr:hypothetical protein [uncultured Methanobrevibacter sp.]
MPICRTDHIVWTAWNLAAGMGCVDMAKMENYCPKCRRIHANPKVQL